MPCNTSVAPQPAVAEITQAAKPSRPLGAVLSSHSQYRAARGVVRTPVSGARMALPARLLLTDHVATVEGFEHALICERRREHGDLAGYWQKCTYSERCAIPRGGLLADQSIRSDPPVVFCRRRCGAIRRPRGSGVPAGQVAGGDSVVGAVAGMAVDGCLPRQHGPATEPRLSLGSRPPV
jgi:hypothetical protein